VKTKLASFDHAALLGVLQDLYAADEASRAFLHARFGLSDDPLRSSKKTIDRVSCPARSRAEYWSSIR